MTTDTTKRRRAGGREARKAARITMSDAPNPCPPGALGGRYQPLRDDECTQIIDTAMRILAEIGMGEVPERLQTQALAKGARLNHHGRLCFPRELIQEIIAGACKSFTYMGRRPERDIEIGGERVFFGTGGAAVQTLDLTSGRYRPSTLADLVDFARLVDRLDAISWFTRCCVATDLEDIFELDLNTVFALLKGTSKPVGTSFTLAEHVPPIMTMVDEVLAATGAPPFIERPFMKAHISPIISPLRYGEDAVDVTLACIEHGIPINAIIAAQSGATAPATLAGFLAQTTAETLAALALVNLFKPGYPMIFSNWPLVIDLRTGAFCGGGGEISVLNAASAQISNRLGLISGVASSMSDAKAVDAQMGSEKAMSSVAAGLSGANMVYESAGMMGSLLGASFEAFVADNEMLSHVNRMIRGVDVNEDTLGFQAILDAIQGDGHFLGADHTIAAMQRDYYYPPLADRQTPVEWNDAGGPQMWQRAKQKAQEILADRTVPLIDPGLEADLRKRYPLR